MKGRLMLYIDQHGNRWWARSVRELRQQIGNGSSRVSKMYHDKYVKPGSVEQVTYHTGYVVGQHWCTAFVPYEVAV